MLLITTIAIVSSWGILVHCQLDHPTAIFSLRRNVLILEACEPSFYLVAETTLTTKIFGPTLVRSLSEITMACLLMSKGSAPIFYTPGHSLGPGVTHSKSATAKELPQMIVETHKSEGTGSFHRKQPLLGSSHMGTSLARPF